MAIRLATTNLFIYLIGNYGDHQGDLLPCHGSSINLLYRHLDCGGSVKRRPSGRWRDHQTFFDLEYYIYY